MFRIALVGLLLATLSTTVSAEPRTASVTVTRSDVSSSVARAKLNRRITAAIEEVCGSYGAIETSQVPEMDACWKAALADVAQRLAIFEEKLETQVAAH